MSICWTAMNRRCFPRLQVEAHEAMPPPPVIGGLIHLPPLCPTHQAQLLKGKLTSPAMEHMKVSVPQTLKENRSLPQVTSLVLWRLTYWHLYSPVSAPHPSLHSSFISFMDSCYLAMLLSNWCCFQISAMCLAPCRMPWWMLKWIRHGSCLQGAYSLIDKLR